MIKENNAKCYCSEDISLIENYNQAISDQKRMWDIHHRRECDENGQTLLTHKQLVEMDLYYHRPASELIFVTRSMHNKLHRERSVKGGKSSSGIEKRLIPILQFTKDGTFIKEWQSAKEAECQLGIARTSICACLKGRLKSAGGFVWRYKMK